MRKDLRTTIIAKLVLVLVVVVPTLAFQTADKPRAKRNQPPKIESFTASTKVFAYCPFTSCSAAGNLVRLEVSANDPDSDNLSYKYSASSGVITGKGAIVEWDLSKTRLGVQTARVEVTDHRGAKASSTISVDVVMCGACDPPCPTVSVSCPAEVTQGEVALFAANVSGNEKFTYLWSHSNGKRISGPAGPKLRIKAIGSVGDVITASVEVGGFDPSCSRKASCETRIVKPTVKTSK